VISPNTLTEGVPKVPKGCSEGFCHFRPLVYLRVLEKILLQQPQAKQNGSVQMRPPCKDELCKFPNQQGAKSPSNPLLARNEQVSGSNPLVGSFLQCLFAARTKRPVRAWLFLSLFYVFFTMVRSAYASAGTGQALMKDLSIRGCSWSIGPS
jgi:hypothetical protein